MPIYEDAGTVTKAVIKSNPGTVFGFRITNTGAALRWFQIHDKATVPVAGDVPSEFFPLDSGSPAQPTVLEMTREQLDGGSVELTGLGWAISTTPGIFTDAATAAEHTVTVRYQ